MRRFLALCTLVIGLAACNGAAVPTVATPTAPIAVAEVPVLAPLPTATPNTGLLKWHAFMDYQKASGDEEAPALAKWCSTCFDNGDYAAFATSMQPDLDVVNERAAWLAANPPDDCYRPTYDAYLKSVELDQQSLQTMQRGARSKDNNVISEGLALAQQSFSLDAQSQNTIAASYAACGS